MRDPHHLISMLDHLAKTDTDCTGGLDGMALATIFSHTTATLTGARSNCFTQIDVIHDEAKGYWEPRPWHEDSPMYPKTWKSISRPPTTGDRWILGSGPLISRDFEEMMNLRTERWNFSARQRAVVTVSTPAGR